MGIALFIIGVFVTSFLIGCRGDLPAAWRGFKVVLQERRGQINWFSRNAWKMVTIIVLTGVVTLIVLSTSVTSHYVDDIKLHAAQAWRGAGFQIVGYEGYENAGLGSCWGGKVWYTVKRSEDHGVLYHGFICKWGNEYHLYSITAIDAIKGD